MSDFSAPTMAMIPFRPPPGLSLPGEEDYLPSFTFPKGTWNLCQAEGSTTPEGDSVSENKEVRKLEKKLRDICKLEAKLAAGERVDPLQLKKIEKKDEVEEEIRALKESLTSKMGEYETPFDVPAPPPGFNQLSAGKLGFATFNELLHGASLVDVCEDDATTLPGSAASDQGGDSDSEGSPVSEMGERKMSASAPVFMPTETHPAFYPMPYEAMTSSALPFVPMAYTDFMMPTTRTPLKSTKAVFTPGGQLRQEAPVFVPTAFPPVEAVTEKAETEEKVTWRSTQSNTEKQAEVKPMGRTKLSAGSAELFVPQFPDLKASVDMKVKDKAKAKKVAQI